VVSGLKQQDFELYEDGAKQQIEYFSQDKLPLSIAFKKSPSLVRAPSALKTILFLSCFEGYQCRCHWRPARPAPQNNFIFELF